MLFFSRQEVWFLVGQAIMLLRWIWKRCEARSSEAVAPPGDRLW